MSSPKVWRAGVELLLVGVLAGCQGTPTGTAATPGVEPAAPVESGPIGCSDQMMARIGDESIPMSRHDAIMGLKRQKYADRGREIPATAEQRYLRSIAERVIYQELLALEVAKLGRDYDSAELDESMASARAKTDDWAGHLRRRGESEDSLRDLAIASAREKLIVEQRAALEPTPAELEAELERIGALKDASTDRVWAWSVLLEVDPNRPGLRTLAEARSEAEKLADLARPPDAPLGALTLISGTEMGNPNIESRGYVGFVTAAEMAKEWSEPVFAAQVGEVVLIETPGGVHVVKVLGHWGPGPLPTEQFEAEITERVAARKLREARAALKDELFERYAPLDCVALRVGPDPRRQG